MCLASRTLTRTILNDLCRRCFIAIDFETAVRIGNYTDNKSSNSHVCKIPQNGYIVVYTTVEQIEFNLFNFFLPLNQLNGKHKFLVIF